MVTFSFSLTSPHRSSIHPSLQARWPPPITPSPPQTVNLPSQLHPRHWLGWRWRQRVVQGLACAGADRADFHCLMVLLLYNTAANTVLYMYCKAVHGKLAFEIAREYVSLPFETNNRTHKCTAPSRCKINIHPTQQQQQTPLNGAMRTASSHKPV